MYRIFNVNDLSTVTETSISSEKPESKNNVQYKEEQDIKYMNPIKIFKLPLSFAGTRTFYSDFKTLNPEVSDVIEDKKRFLITFEDISYKEVNVNISLTVDPSINVYSFTDKTISVPRLENNEVLIERRIKGKHIKVYLIDQLTSEILIVKYQPKSMGTIKPSKTSKTNVQSLSRFATIDIETLSFNINKHEKQLIPFLIGSHDFMNNETRVSLLPHPHINQGKNYLEKDKYLQTFLMQIFTGKFNKYRIYAHNLSSFDGVLLLRTLIAIGDRHNIKIEPLIRDNKIISIKCRYEYRKDLNKYRYSIEFRDSYLLLLSSLEKLSKTFLKEQIDLQKMELPDYIKEALISGNGYIIKNHLKGLSEYCERDCVSLGHIIHKFALYINENFGLNIHNYPTLPSLAMAIYRIKDLKDLLFKKQDLTLSHTKLFRQRLNSEIVTKEVKYVLSLN